MVAPAPAPAKPDRDSDIMFSEDGSTWMEVASPQPLHSLAHLRTNIAKEVTVGDNSNTGEVHNPGTPGASSIFIKTEKGLNTQSEAAATTTAANSAKHTVPTPAGIGSASKIDPYSGKPVPSYNVPSTPVDKSTAKVDVGGSSAVKSSAKKGLV